MSQAVRTILRELDEFAGVADIEEALERVGQGANDELRRNVLLARYPVHVAWDCTNSSTGKCVYDNAKDPAHDCCLVCRQPEERK